MIPDQELRDLVASLAVSGRETDRRMQETDRILKESLQGINILKESLQGINILKESLQGIDILKEGLQGIGMLKEDLQRIDRIMDRVALQTEKTERQMEKTERTVDRVCGKVGNMDDNIGSHAEQFYQGVFERKPEFGGIKYDEVVPNMRYKDNADEMEIDIVLINGTAVALIEVKSRIHPDFVKELATKRVEKFKRCFPKFATYKVYLGIAGFSFSDKVLVEAKEYGVGIVKQVGDGVEIETGHLLAY